MFYSLHKGKACTLALLLILSTSFHSLAQSGNVLLIIADDLGLDALKGYNMQGMKPNTPHIDSLRNSGLSFTNAWSSPVCTPTRAGMMSGKYGIKTGVLKAPGHLDTSHTSLAKALKQLKKMLKIFS